MKRIFDASCLLPAPGGKRKSSSERSVEEHRRSPTGKPFLVPPKHSTSTPAHRDLRRMHVQRSDRTQARAVHMHFQTMPPPTSAIARTSSTLRHGADFRRLRQRDDLGLRIWMSARRVTTASMASGVSLPPTPGAVALRAAGEEFGACRIRRFRCARVHGRSPSGTMAYSDASASELAAVPLNTKNTRSFKVLKQVPQTVAGDRAGRGVVAVGRFVAAVVGGDSARSSASGRMPA